MTPHKAHCMIIFESDNGDITDYPVYEETSLSFDATDLSINGWMQQFKKVLTVAGFADQTIKEYLGDV